MPIRRPTRSSIVALACALGALLALTALSGCGSSASTAGGSGHSTTAGGQSSATNAAPGTTGTTGTTGSLKVTGTPRYASPSPSAPVLSGTVHVAYRNIAIAPDAIKVKLGSTIEWRNYDPIDHNVTSEGGPQRFASRNFGEHGTFKVRVLKPGVIHYECTIHPASMNGTIEVVR